MSKDYPHGKLWGDTALTPLVLPPAEPERLPKGEPSPADLDRMFKAELKRRRKAAKRLKECGHG